MMALRDCSKWFLVVVVVVVVEVNDLLENWIGFLTRVLC